MSLKDSDAMATIAVKNLKTARTFYQETLEVTPAGNDEAGVVNFRSGRSTVIVYQSQFAGTNQATAATWQVPDVTSVVDALKGKGVKFEHYDLPGLTREGDLHVAGNFRGAWLKDPDGNILHVFSM